MYENVAELLTWGKWKGVRGTEKPLGKKKYFVYNAVIFLGRYFTTFKAFINQTIKLGTIVLW